MTESLSKRRARMLIGHVRTSRRRKYTPGREEGSSSDCDGDVGSVTPQ